MPIEVYIGGAAVIITLCCFIAPVLSYRQWKEKREYLRALYDHGIVYCAHCEEYKIGKYNLCDGCIKDFANGKTITPGSITLIKGETK
jgi:hypothetical protein